jgi:hypothetical protein
MVSAKDTIKTPAYFLEKICERSIKGKRLLLAGWKEGYLLKVLSGISQFSISMRLP